MDTKRYIISDAAKMVDVEAHVLRYWEDELELPIARNEMGHRYYTEDNIRMFHHIKELKEQGYQLKAIKVLLPEVEQGKTPPAIVQQPAPPVSDRMEQFQNILGKVVAGTIFDAVFLRIVAETGFIKFYRTDTAHEIFVGIIRCIEHLHAVLCFFGDIVSGMNQDNIVVFPVAVGRLWRCD